MNAAELDTRRRALGLSIAETAELVGASVRTISYWFAGNGEPRDPDDIAERLLDIETRMGDVVEAISESVSDASEVAQVTLTRYRTQEALDASGNGYGLPLGAHAMMIAWAVDDLRSDGHLVVVEWVA